MPAACPACRRPLSAAAAAAATAANAGGAPPLDSSPAICDGIGQILREVVKLRQERDDALLQVLKIKGGGGGGGGAKSRATAAAAAAKRDSTSHPGYQCDKCEVEPIVGVRYTLESDDYDLCQSCFDGLDHRSPLVNTKLYTAVQPGRQHTDPTPRPRSCAADLAVGAGQDTRGEAGGRGDAEGQQAAGGRRRRAAGQSGRRHGARRRVPDRARRRHPAPGAAALLPRRGALRPRRAADEGAGLRVGPRAGHSGPPQAGRRAAAGPGRPIRCARALRGRGVLVVS
eukprot:SAG22_NODE_8_length_37215_cov_120.960351_25_plen_285_part_00